MHCFRQKLGLDFIFGPSVLEILVGCSFNRRPDIGEELHLLLTSFFIIELTSHSLIYYHLASSHFRPCNSRAMRNVRIPDLPR